MGKQWRGKKNVKHRWRPGLNQQSRPASSYGNRQGQHQHQHQQQQHEHSNKKFQLFVKNPCGKNYVFQLSPTDTVKKLHSKIVARGVHSDNFFLIYGSKVLDSGRTLISYQLEKDSTVRLIYRVANVVQEQNKEKERKDKEAKERLKVFQQDGLRIGQPQYRVQLLNKEAVKIAVRQNWQALQFVNKAIIQQLTPYDFAPDAAMHQGSQPFQANHFACGPIIYYDPKNISRNGALALEFIRHNPMAYTFVARTKCIKHLATNIDIIEATLKSANDPFVKKIRRPKCHNGATARPMKMASQSSHLTTCNLCATEVAPSDRRWVCGAGGTCGHTTPKHVCLVCHGEINSKTKVARPQLFSTLAAVQKVLSTATTYHFEAVQRQEQPAPLAPDANKLKQEKLYTR